jgi:glycosyltransferase involved in cell wall biosynthesis
MGTARLSLCIIAGNEETVIRRCLDTFAKGIPVDELIVVRAYGCTPPDRTLEIAREYGAKTAEYKNAPEHADWPHIDNFAAARNVAWDMATGDVLMWVDCDDTAVPHTLKRIRELADNMPADMVRMPYVISGQPISPLRERLFKRGISRWENAVHECCPINPGCTHYVVKDAAILHTPEEHKQGSNARNIRILDTVKDKNNSEKFYYHMELLGMKRFEEAAKAGIEAWKDPALPEVNKYEVLMNLNSLATTPQKKATLLHEGMKLSPWRREAVGRLACDAMDEGDNERALAYARMMCALPAPVPPTWNQRHHLYGWAGKMILAQALRLNGDDAAAERLDRDRCPRPRFSVLHATRSRPHKAAEIQKLFIDRAHDPESVEYIYAVDEDDTESRKVLSRFGLVVVPPGGGIVKAINAAALKARGQILVMAADDCLPPPRWDYDVWQKMGDVHEPRVLAVSDGYRKDALITHPIMNRAFYRRQGYFFCPEYPHLFCDTELTHRAHRAGQIIDGRDLIFRHNNPIFTGERPDALAQERNSLDAYRIGSEIFKRRNPDAQIK